MMVESDLELLSGPGGHEDDRSGRTPGSRPRATPRRTLRPQVG